MVTYNPLWKTLIDKGLMKTQLRENIGFSTTTLAKMSKGGYVSLEVIEKICLHLDCNVEDVVEIKK